MPVRMKYPGRRVTGCAVISIGGGSRCRRRSPRLRRNTRCHGSSSHNSAGGPGSPASAEFAPSGVAGSHVDGSRWGLAAVLSGIILDRGASTRIIAEIESLPSLSVQMGSRSEEHTSELQSLRHLVCRLLL